MPSPLNESPRPTGPGGPADPLEPLLAHVAWVRRLAHRMVADSHRADDLVQETFVAALAARRRRTGGARAFLAGVLKHRFLQLGRSEGRRRAHESSVEPREHAPAADEALERAELGRELVQLVVDLEQPFRDVVLLRYFSELEPRAIAEQLGVPLKTVESRLSRGRARLRESWKRRFPGGEDMWLGALAWLGAPPGVPAVPCAPSHPFSTPAAELSGSVVPTLGAVLVNTKLVLIALAIVAGSGIYWLTNRDHAGTPEMPARAGSLFEHDTLAAPPEIAMESPAAGRSQVPDHPVRQAKSATVNTTKPKATPVAAPPTRSLHGRVVDPNARPLAAVTVAFTPQRGEPVRTTSAANGRFEFEVERTNGRVAAEGAEFENMFVFHPHAIDDTEMLLVVAPHRELGGVVRDANGRPMSDVSVALELPANFRTRFDTVLDTADATDWSTTTNAEGRFRIHRAPVVDAAKIVARLDGYLPATLEPPPGPFDGLDLVLQRPVVFKNALAGRVIDARGQPAARALVSLGKHTTTTDEDGSFLLELDADEDASPAREIIAVRAGELPGRFRATLNPSSEEPDWPSWIELRLGDEPLELAGRVIDAEGKPRAGVKLWIADPTTFGVIGDDLTAQLENLAAPEDSTYAEGSDAYFRSTTTDAKGAFRLQGLCEREYRVGLMDTTTLARLEVGPFLAGRRDIKIEIRSSELTCVVGRVLSRAGVPVEGVKLALHAHMFGGVHERGGTVTSDSDGQFAFDGVALEPFSIWMRGDNIVPSVHQFTPDIEQLELVVDALCHIKVDASTRPDLASHVRVFDAQGGELLIFQIGAHGYLRSSLVELIDGRTPTLGVPENATTLVLLKDGDEVRRIEISPEIGKLYRVQP